MSKDAPNVRYAEVDQENRWCRVHLVLDLDGGTRRDIQTGYTFLDRLLEDLALYASIDLGISAEATAGESHHLIEAIGSCFGRAVAEALENADSVETIGHAYGIVEDALVSSVIDLQGRGTVVIQSEFNHDKVGGLFTETLLEFFRMVGLEGKMTIHLHKVSARSDHHLAEAMFQGFGKALGAAVKRVDRRTNVVNKPKKD